MGEVFETRLPLLTQEVHQNPTTEKLRQYRRSDRDVSAIYRKSPIIGKSEAIFSKWVVEQKLHCVLHTARRSSVYAVHPDCSLYTLLMLQISHEPIDNECLFTVTRS